jgi:hypothetical protein
LVVGGGHSATNNVLNLLELKQRAPETTILWALRRGQMDRVYGGQEADALPARGRLGTRARQVVESGEVELLAPFSIQSIEPAGSGLLVQGAQGSNVRSISVDEVIVATGFRPNIEMLRELRLSLDPTLESSLALGPLIDPNVHSCGTVRPHGFRELAHPEPGFFVIGMKSYGRAPTFLMATGFEQARSVVAHLAGDDVAASRVELVLPETGVCGGTSLSTDPCCGASTGLPNQVELEVSATSACCGGPASEASNACCLLDEDSKKAGLEGCGCGSPAASGLGTSFVSIQSL